jgi:hypothetical protein
MDRENKKNLYELYARHPFFEDAEHVNQRHKAWCAVRLGDPYEIFKNYAYGMN